MSGTRQLDRELERLVVGTNDQRRRVGQTLYHFHRTLIFWKDHGLGFLAVTRAWSAGGAAIFDSMARTLAELGEPARDEPLRAFTAGFLRQLAEDLERGDHMLVPFLRWLEGRFPELTAMMQAESPASRIHDVDLAERLATTFVGLTRAPDGEVPASLRAAADGISARPPR